MSNAHELSNALFDTLKPTIEKVDRSVQNVYDSQTLLKDQLDHLEKGMCYSLPVDSCEPFRPLTNVPTAFCLFLQSSPSSKTFNRLHLWKIMS